MMEALPDTIADALDEGVIAIDRTGRITLFNRAAGRITGIDPDSAKGTPVLEVLPNSPLPDILKTGAPERETEIVLSGQTRVLANRLPLFDKAGAVVGAVSVFRDVTRVTDLADQNIALKEIQSLLEAIINASLDAISVVDEEGRNLLINPAYTRLTGLTAEDVIGKPAEIDIAEGESAHMRVLTTRKPIRRARLKVKPRNRDVLANVAPITVDGNLKGSVAIVHDLSELQNLAEELSQARNIIRTLSAKYTFSDIVGRSEPIKTAVRWAREAAAVPATVLLRGESGTGKELFAHAIHHSSGRRDNQFIRVNCAAVVESLFESELFGYEEGAFTGAKRGGRKGLIEEGNHGTLFFDEVSELSMNTQAKLLRALQEKEIIRVGGSKTLSVDVRIIAATHVNLEAAVQEGRFRQDLYYRLNVMPIFIPPLRQLTEDLADLADHILKKLNRDFGRHVTDIHPSAMGILKAYPWYGNVRELENVLAQSVTRMQFNESTILPGHLPELHRGGTDPLRAAESSEDPPPDHLPAGRDRDLKMLLTEVEKNHILHVLAENRWNKVATAGKLGISIRSLYNKIERYGIGNP
jgi:PAS domain S-box-containing protein